MFLMIPYGSRVYGTTGPNSDEDYMGIILLPRSCTGEEYRHNDLNVHLYNKVDFQKQLDIHKIHTLEAWYLPDSPCHKHFKFQLNLHVLRESISEKANHSFVKAKKKIEIEKDYYIGQKSLFHSLRILTFGIHIARDGKIDFGAANQYWRDIIESGQYNWEYYKNKYQPIYNSLATEFRKLAPKE
jgi:predicted nucleotidyltransferase